MVRDVYLDGVLRERWDDTTQMVSFWSLTGVLTTRAFSAGESADIAGDAAVEAARAAVKLIISDLVAEKARVQPVIDKTNASITGADTKDVARAAKRIADAAIELARFVLDK